MAHDLRPPPREIPNRAFRDARLDMADVDPVVRRNRKAAGEGWRGRTWALEHPEKLQPGPGRKPHAAAEQERRIAELDRKNWPKTEIAEEVFGDKRRQDRVRRVLRRLSQSSA